ncbi:hypothetical protein Tco_1484816 [Tanacetum coccineum]
MELHDVSYGIDSVARPLLLFFSSENQLLWFRYREYDLAHLKLVFEFCIYRVWKSVRYGVSKGLDTAYWGFLRVLASSLVALVSAGDGLRTSSASVLQVLRRLGSIFTSVYAAKLKRVVSLLDGLQGGKMRLYVKGNNAIYLRNCYF